eukprot:292480-Pelagomonas_calceolata.AAC.7
MALTGGTTAPSALTSGVCTFGKPVPLSANTSKHSKHGMRCSCLRVPTGGMSALMASHAPLCPLMETLPLTQGSSMTLPGGLLGKLRGMFRYVQELLRPTCNLCLDAKFGCAPYNL